MIRRRGLAWAGGYGLPVLAWGGLIFWMSSRTSSQVDEQVDSLDWFPLLAETSHFGAYFILAILVWRLLASLVRPGAAAIELQDLVVVNLAGAAAFAYALSDEYHQTFVPGRTFAIEDLAVDLAGIVTGLGAALIVRSWLAKRRQAASGSALQSPARGPTI